MRLFVSCLTVVALAAGLARAECRIAKVATTALTLEGGNRAVVDIAMNEHHGRFEIDTGSADTVLDPHFAQAAHVGLDRHAGQMTMVGAGSKESIPIWRAHVRQTEVGALAFQDWEYPVLTEALPSTIPIDGLLGNDFMHFFDIELDFPAGTMSLWRLFDCADLHPAWTGDYDAIEMKPTKRQGLSMPIWIDNAFLDVMFDTGAGGLLLTHDAATRAGATSGGLAADRVSQGQGIGGGFDVVRHRFDTLLIGSGQFDKPEIAVDPARDRASGFDAYDGRDGLLGLGYFKADRIWISYGTKTLFLQSPAQARAQKK